MVTTQPTRGRGRPRLSTLEKSLNQYYRDIGALDKATARRIESAFRQALDGIEAEQNRIFEKFQKVQGVTDTTSLRFQLSRLDTLGNQARVIMNQFGNDVAEAIASAQTGATFVSERHMHNSILNYYQGDAAVAASFQQLPAPALTELVGNLSDGSPLATLANQFGAEASAVFQTEMIKGTALGLSPKTVARNFQDALGISKAKAQTIARTEMMRASRESMRRSMDKNSDVVTGWQWYCTLSDRTCPMCWAMHGKKFKTKERMATHPNCRCTMLPILKPYREMGIPVDEPIEHPTLHKSGPVLFSEQRLAIQKKVLGPAAYKAFQKGEINLEDFIGEVDNPVWGKTRYAKSLSQILGKDKAKQYYGQRFPKPDVAKRTPQPSNQQAGGSNAVLREPGEFQSYDDSVKWMASNYPHIHWDMEDVDIGQLNHLTKQFDRLSKDWPEVNKRLQYMGTYKGRPYNGVYGDNVWNSQNAMAWATNDGTQIAFNPKYYRTPSASQAFVSGDNRPRIYEALGRAKKSGWLVSDDPASIMTHEWGHQVHNYLLTVTDQSMSKWSLHDRSVIARLTDDKLLKQASSRLSDYGATNPYESFAESFSHYYHRRGTPDEILNEEWLTGFNNLIDDITGKGTEHVYLSGDWTKVQWGDSHFDEAEEAATRLQRRYRPEASSW